jgi:hypothetical protein
MPFRLIPDTNTRYGLLSFDAHGAERRDDPDGVMSERLRELAAAGDVTNVFIFSHGWMGDVPAALRQYDLWIKAFDTLTADRERASMIFPGFRPLYIGLHWPSLPWGDEELEESGDGSFSAEDTSIFDERMARYLEWLGDTPGVRQALTTILAEADAEIGPDELAPHVRDAFLALDAELGLGGGPDADGLPFDPDQMAAAQDGVSFGESNPVVVLDMLRTLSYWSMKKRARRIGEGAMHDFLRRLQQVIDRQRMRIHLMGHSFGCVVISSILGGPGGRSPLERPVDSVALVQGAVSLWSYAAQIPGASDPGYFCDIITRGKVRGPLITTRSRHDAAVNKPYRLASQLSGAYSFDAEDYPKYGAVGRFGLQGLPRDRVVDTVLLGVGEPYGFACGHVYNLESSRYICKLEGAAGAHNDIGGREVAHAIWEAALASGADSVAHEPS